MEALHERNLLQKCCVENRRFGLEVGTAKMDARQNGVTAGVNGTYW
jgi:hypothetical protein